MERATWWEWRWHCCLWMLLAALIFVNPIGYVGGGWDDWHYLTAARCWAESGLCIPSNHWEARWPVFAPIAVVSNFLGESRFTIGIWPLASSAVAASLIAVIGNRLFYAPVGLLAAATFAVTPAFSIQLIGPSAEAIELAFQLAGIAFIIAWFDRSSLSAAFAAGLCFAFAFQVKETSLITAMIAGIYVLAKRPRSVHVMAAAAGFCVPLAIEFLGYWAVTDDPLYRRNLALTHAQIPSTELRQPIDQSASPILNKSLISGWKREPGLHVHWLLDGFVNLFVNAKAGLTLWLAPLSLVVLRSVLTSDERRSARLLVGLAFLYILVLIFIFSIDPKPRMMFVPLAGTTMALAIIVTAAWNAGRRLLPAVLIGAHVLTSIAVLFGHPRTNVFEKPAKAWVDRLDDQLAVDLNTSRHLALIPAARSLPGLESNRRYWLRLSLTGCAASKPVVHAAGQTFDLISVQLSPQPQFPAMQSPLELCVYRRRDQSDDQQVQRMPVQQATDP